MMIDWITCKIPFYAPFVVDGGRFISVAADGSIDFETPKRKQLRGSYDSSMTVRTTLVDANGHTEQVELSGNPVKFLQGHNVWGSQDLPNLVVELVLKVSHHLSIIQPPQFLAALMSSHGTISRVDINEMFDLGTRSNVLTYLHHIGENSRTRAQSAVTSGTTVYLNKTSRRWSIKLYSKGQEVELPRNNKQGTLKLTDSLKSYTDPMLRIELTLKSNELRENGLHLLSAWNGVECDQVFDDYYSRLTMPDQQLLEIPDNLPNSLKLTYVSWFEGHDIRSMVSRPTFYRHRKQLLEFGIDISLSSSKGRTDPSKVVPLVRTITLKPAVVPSWAYGTHLFFEPRKLCKV